MKFTLTIELYNVTGVTGGFILVVTKLVILNMKVTKWTQIWNFCVKNAKYVQGAAKPLLKIIVKWIVPAVVSISMSHVISIVTMITAIIWKHLKILSV